MNVHERINGWFMRNWFWIVMSLVFFGGGVWIMSQVVNTYVNDLNPDFVTNLAGIAGVLFTVLGSIFLVGLTLGLRRALKAI